MFSQIIRKLSAQFGLPLCGLRTIFMDRLAQFKQENRAKGILINDDAPLNEAGNQLLAEHLLKIITQRNSDLNMLKLRARSHLALCLVVFWSGLAFAQIPSEDLQKIEKAVPQQASAKPQQPRTLLVFTRAEGYKHSSIPYAAKALELIGKQTGAFSTVISAEMSAFAPDNLQQFDAVLFASTTQLAFDDFKLRQSLMTFVQSGKGIIGIHAATDNFYNWPEAADMLGGHFDGHPWTSDGTWIIKISDPAHPLTAAFRSKNFAIRDEIYRIRARSLRQNARVLVALDMADKANRAANGVRFNDRDIPISWVRRFGEGRVFYSSLGHNHEIYWNPAILQHFLAGIQYALGDLPVETTPLPFEVEKSFLPGEIDKLFEKIKTYEYGESREPLVNLLEYFRLAAASPKLQHENEARLLQILTGKATLPGKQFVCEQLSLIGSKASVPTLIQLLHDSSASDMARYALERIPDPAADQALRKALAKSSGAIRLGIINTIGQRRDAHAVAELGKLAKSSEAATAAAAINALGKIGDEKSAKILAEAKDKTTGAMQTLVCDAYLNCASLFLKQGKMDKAGAIYAQLNRPNFSEATRFAALRGMVQTRRENVNEFVLSLIKNPEAQMQTLGVNLVSEIPATESVAGIAQILPVLSPANQMQLLFSLAERPEDEVRQAAVLAAQSQHREVRVAALQALGKVGDASAVLLLANAAAAKSLESASARKSLYRLGGPNVDETIVAGVASAAPEVQIELILAVNQRRIKAAAPALLQAAKSPETPVRLEAVRALRVIAEEIHLPDLVELLVQAPNAAERNELQQAVIAAALSTPLQKRSGAAVLNHFKKIPPGTNAETRKSLLHVLGSIGDKAALPVLLDALKDTSAGVITTAINALSEWPSAEPGDHLLAVAERSPKRTHQILALRGFVRLLRFESDRPSPDTIKKFRRALELAANAEEQKMILGWLADVKALQAMDLAMVHMKNEALRAEAEVAAVKIAGAISGSYPAETKARLQEVLQGAKADTLAHLQQARAVLQQIEHSEDFMTQWLVSGPYVNPDENVFDFVFPPEQAGQGEIKWQIMPASMNAGTPWLLDLAGVFDRENCAAYLRNQIWSEREQRVRLELGSDDGIKAWLHGELIHAHRASRGVTPGDDAIEISLRPGWNPLLLKITQATGGWGACARLRNLDGSSVSGVKVALPEE